MTREHALLLAGFLALTGTQIAGLAEWTEVTKPLWVGTFLGQLGLFIRACYSNNGNTERR